MRTKRIGTLVFGGMLAAAAITRAAVAQTDFVNWESPHVSPLALTPSGGLLLAVNTADNRLEVFDVSGPGEPARVFAVPVGLDPVSVRARNDGEAWVVNRVSDSVSVVDIASGRVVKTIRVGDEPADVIFAGTPRRAFVTIAQRNEVWVYDPADVDAGPVVVAIAGEDPRSLAASADGSRVYAGIFESGNRTTPVAQFDVSAPSGPYGGQNPPPNDGAGFLPPMAPGLPTPPAVALIVRKDAGGAWRDVNGANWSNFVAWDLADHDVAIIDTATLGVTYADGLMTSVTAVAERPDGMLTAIGTESKNEVRFEPNVRGVFVRAEMAVVDPSAPAAASVMDLNPHLTYAVAAIPGPQREESIGHPRGIAWNAVNGRAYVTGMGSNNVIVTDAAGGRLARIGVGEGPTGVVVSADGARAFVLNKFGGSVSVIDTATNVEASRVAFFDPTPAAIREGRPLLYDTHAGSGLGQASCASCHQDGKTDGLAWDLGDPSGAVKAFNQNCRQASCGAWHPMKGPMVTQSLQGIVGVEPLHWRGDREDVAAFAPAFVSLQGADEAPSPAQMQALTEFVATIRYPPSPNQNFDGTMPAEIATTDGTPGHPGDGLSLFLNRVVVPGNIRCVTCHTLPEGSSKQIDDPQVFLVPQGMKTAQLRGLWTKIGWRRTSQANTRGFGFDHHSDFDTLKALIGAGFSFDFGAAGQQQRRDVEAFLLCFPTETHAGVGQQQTIDGTNTNEPAVAARLDAFVTLAHAGDVGLVVHGVLNGEPRGWYDTGSGVMQSDRAAETIAEADLRLLAGEGSELTYTLVPAGTQRRMGVERDGDGFLDGDERDNASDPANPASVPCDPDFDGSGSADQDDVVYLINVVGGGDNPSGADPDYNKDGNVNQDDVVALINRIAGGGCP